MMANWVIPREFVIPYLPAGLEIDEFAGQTYVSLVGFQFLRTKLKGWSIPGHQNFPEVNLRLYVRRQVGNEVRRGVVFVKEIVPKWAVTWVARWCYNEPYATHPLRDVVQPTPEGLQIGYHWQQGANRFQLTANCAGTSLPLSAGSLEEFIAEHYWGYGRSRKGALIEYQVCHPRWNYWQPSDAHISGDFQTLYGSPWGDVLAAAPSSLFVADGSAVEVFPPSRSA